MPVYQAQAVRAFVDDGWEYPHHHNYQAYICELMSFHHGRIDDPYPRNKPYTKDELLSLTPAVVRLYLTWKAYLDPYPRADARVINARAESLRKVKQGISYFMPNKSVAWLDGVGGNPTHHHSIHELINKIEEKETKGLGVDPNDKRAYTSVEYRKALELLRDHPSNDFEISKKYHMMTLWAHHLIHRMDDTAHFRTDAPHGNTAFPFTLKTKTKWSKNVKKAIHCPDQIILGDDNWKTCTILWLALYLEERLGMYPNAKFLFTDNPDDKKGPDNLKKNYHNNMSKHVWSHQAFVALFDQTGEDAEKGLGAHSVRKNAADEADKAGADTPQTQYRGRWIGEKGRTTVGRVYIKKDDPYTDAFVAGLLCDGGPVKYELQEGLLVTDAWLFNCVPNIYRRYRRDHRMCRVLALAYLWAAWDEHASQYVPAVEQDRIRTRFVQDHGAVPGNQNPVRKIKLHIIKNNRRLDIVEQVDQRGTDGQPQQQQQQQQQPVQVQGGSVTNEQILAAIQRMERNHSQELGAVKAAQVADRQWLAAQIESIKRNQRSWGGTIESGLARQDRRRQARRRELDNAAVEQRQEAGRQQQQQQSRQHQPAGRQQQQQQQQQRPRQQQQQLRQQPVACTRVTAGGEALTNRYNGRIVRVKANLSRNLCSLYLFHEEFVHGIGDNIPARLFTSDERNRNKGFAMKYGRRLLIWKTQEYLMNHNFTLEAANDRIIDVYGSATPTAIINMMKNDQKNPSYTFVGSIRFHPRIIIRGDPL